MSSLARDGAVGVEPPPVPEAAALLRQARALARPGGAGQSLMAGKKLALLSSLPGDRDGTEFFQAAQALGAHVSFVRAGLDEASSDAQVDATSRMLGQLYDAVECQHLPPALVRRLARSAGVPVFEGLATPDHPTARLAEALEGEASPDAKRRCILQAVLLLSMN